MKKIININLSGRVIPIEDSAYEKLQGYIESLRRYFANEEGKDEIINDIESRIAELMNEKIRKGASAVTDTDIEEIITSMGRVEDFEAEEKQAAAENAQPAAQQNYTYTEKKNKRLYRDTNDKFIGGVCSGIAAYLNVDPAIVRLLFAIITFGGFGFGVLVYIILWIILPPKDLEGYIGKRLYRNPDDKLIGGVAGGLAAYFNKSTSTIRLIFAAPLLLSILVGIIKRISWSDGFDLAWNIGFGSLSGTFILAYIILWIVLPEALSDYQKMEMRGETVDVNRIRQNVREGMENMKEKMKGWGEEVKASAENLGNKAKEFANTRGKTFAAEVNETVRRRNGGLGHAIGVIFKVFFLFIAGTIAFGLFVSLIALLFGGIAWWPINKFLWTSNWQQLFAWGTLIFFLIVPLVGFITWIVRRIIRAKSKNNYLGWTFGGLWAIGWVSLALFVSSIVKDFRTIEHVETPVPITQPVKDKMIVAVSQPELEFSGNYAWMNDGDSGWDITSDSLRIAAVKFNVKASMDSQYHVAIKKYGFGRTEKDALNRAGKIQFNVSWKDSVLDLDNGYAIDKESKFRGQYIEMEILVPAGKKIRFDESIERKLNAINVKVKRSYRRNRITGIQIENDEEAFRFRTDIDYTMGTDGELKTPDGVSVNKTYPGEYRYEDNGKASNDSLELEKSIEQKKKELKDLEEIKNKQTKPTTKKKTKKTFDDEAAYAGGPTPVSSLVEWF
jgi:phage shock protein PspC (stress-responsive transcriptional regulator)